MGRQDLKLFAQNKIEELSGQSMQTKVCLPSLEKADYILLSIVVDYCILVAFLILGTVC